MERVTYGVGAHEPIWHRLRTGNSTADEWARWEQETSQENIDLLARLGVDKALIACSKGFGLEYEKPLIERAAKFAERAGRHGIRTSIYVQGFPVYYETFLLEVPEAEGWLGRNQAGDYIPWGGQTFRRWMDPTREEFWEYEKKILNWVLDHFTPCDIFMDNTIVGPCWTESCRRSFRDYLRGKYKGDVDSCAIAASSAAMGAGMSDILREFGLPSFDAVDLPRFDGVYWPMDAYQIVKDPLLQEWARWRSWLTGEFLREMRDAVKARAPGPSTGSGLPLNSTPAVPSLSRGGTRFNSPVGACDGLRLNQLFTHGVDFEDRLGVLDKAFMEESGWRPGVVALSGQKLKVVKDERHPDQAGPGEPAAVRVSTDARWWKVFSNYGGAGHGGIWGEVDRAGKLTALSHNFAFGHKPHHLGTLAPLAAAPGMFDDIADVIAWGNAHIGALAGRDGRVAPIAVWRSTATLGFVRHRPVWEACAIEQMLFENHLPFTILLDGLLEQFCGSTGFQPVQARGTDFQPVLSKVMILPGAACVSDEQVSMITEFVRAGGRLLLLGQSGTRDRRTRLRRKFAFEHLFAGQIPNLERYGPPHWVPELDWRACPERLSADHGRGKVTLVKLIAPRSALDQSRDPYMPERIVAPKDILPPANEGDIMRELLALTGEGLRVEGPRWMLCEFWARGRDLLVCCANLHKQADGGPLTLHLGPLKATSANVHVLLEEKVQTLPVRDGQVTLPTLRHFCALELPGALA